MTNKKSMKLLLFLGLVALAFAHWLCDLVWCYFLSALSFRGGHFFGRRFQEVVFVVCGIFMFFLGTKYILDAAWVFFT